MTVTVSVNAANREHALTVAVNDPVSSTPSARYGLHPEREPDRVDARPQVLDAVPAGAVGDRRPRLFDERGAARFDGHTRPSGHRRDRVTDPRDGRLAERDRQESQSAQTRMHSVFIIVLRAAARPQVLRV